MRWQWKLSGPLIQESNFPRDLLRWNRTTESTPSRRNISTSLQGWTHLQKSSSYLWAPAWRAGVVTQCSPVQISFVTLRPNRTSIFQRSVLHLGAEQSTAQSFKTVLQQVQIIRVQVSPHSDRCPFHICGLIFGSSAAGPELNSGPHCTLWRFHSLLNSAPFKMPDKLLCGLAAFWCLFGLLSFTISHAQSPPAVAWLHVQLCSHAADGWEQMLIDVKLTDEWWWNLKIG